MALRLPTIARTLALTLVLALTASALPVATADRHCTDGACEPVDCKEAGSASAGIANVVVNGVTLQTQAGGTTFVLPLRATGLAMSTTGQLDVEIRHRCVLSYAFTWTVTSQVSGTTTNTVFMTPNCVGGTDVHAIPVGNDVVSVHMELAWKGCDGTSGRDVRDVTVVDPALPGVPASLRDALP